MSLVSLAWRSLWRHKRRTLITISSIALGLTFAIFFVSLALGTYAQLTNDVVRMQAGHLTLEHPAYREAPAVDLWIDHADRMEKTIERLPEVEKVKKLILAQGVAKSGIGAVGVAVIGVDPETEIKLSPLAKKIISGTYLAKEDGAQVVIGSELARHLNLQVGKKLVITSNDVNGTLVEELCRVKGIYKTGSDELDAYLIQVPLDFARKLYGLPPESVTQLGIILKNPDHQTQFAKTLTSMVIANQVAIRSWEEIMPEVAAWIKLDKGSNFIFQAVLLFLILFTIFNTILMSVLERQKEFAVLLAIGTPPKNLCKQILLESALIGLLGSCLGIILGWSISYPIQVWGLDISHLYRQGVSISGFAISTILHSQVTWKLLSVLGGIVFLSTIVVSLLPMRRAANIKVVDLLR